MRNLDSGDLYIPSKESLYRTIVTPRVIALDREGNFPMTIEKGWGALPGGKLKRRQGYNVNLFSSGAYATIVREVEEECGIDISPYISQAALMGITEVTEINSELGQVTERIAPIFLCRVPGMHYGSSVEVANIHGALPGPMYPDARMALNYLQHQLSTQSSGFIEPVFLNAGKVYFQTKPQMGYVLGFPPNIARILTQ